MADLPTRRARTGSADTSYRCPVSSASLLADAFSNATRTEVGIALDDPSQLNFISATEAGRRLAQRETAPAADPLSSGVPAAGPHLEHSRAAPGVAGRVSNRQLVSRFVGRNRPPPRRLLPKPTPPKQILPRANRAIVGRLQMPSQPLARSSSAAASAVPFAAADSCVVAADPPPYGAGAGDDHPSAEAGGANRRRLVAKASPPPPQNLLTRITPGLRGSPSERQAVPTCARSCGAAKSSAGPTGRMPRGLRCRMPP